MGEHHLVWAGSCRCRLFLTLNTYQQLLLLVTILVILVVVVFLDKFIDSFLSDEDFIARSISDASECIRINPTSYSIFMEVIPFCYLSYR